MSANDDENKAPLLSVSDIDAGHPGNSALQPARRRSMTAKSAGKRLALSTLDVSRLVAAGQLDGYWVPGKSGRRVAMVYTDAVDALVERVQRMTPG